MISYARLAWWRFPFENSDKNKKYFGISLSFKCEQLRYTHYKVSNQ